MKIHARFMLLFVFILSLIFTSTHCDLSNLETDEDGGVTIYLTIPPGADVEGKTWEIVFMTDISNMSSEFFDYYSTGICGSDALIEINLDNVDTGTYYLFAVIYMNPQVPDGPRPGDYFGVHGIDLPEEFNPEALTPTAIVSETGNSSFSISMMIMEDWGEWDDGGDDGDGNEDPPNMLSGNLILPAAADGKEWSIYLDTDWDHENGSVADQYGLCESGTNSIPYAIETIPTGTFNLYAVVHVVGTPGSPPVPGDYYGQFANLFIPLNGQLRQDLQLTVFSNP